METLPACHSFLSDTRFYQHLFHIDEAIANAVRAGACACGGVLHSADYPRKPRGLSSALDESYYTRLSFCCDVDGCRRRSTPPSVRFLGRKVYLGTLVILLTALQHGMMDKRRRALIERLDIPPQTLERWQRWWREAFPASRCWRAEQGHFLPPILSSQLPGELQLTAGEKLSVDLRRLDKAYLENNKRTYEIIKHVSLVLHDLLALITLKETGECKMQLPETLFDADYPGHYARYIKSVGLTIPCVVGPYTSINCTLTLTDNSVRNSTSPGTPYAHNSDPDGQPKDDTRFEENRLRITSIATSHGQNDTGMFELNFRDERLLPFEGAGAISTWQFKLPKENSAFDFDTISDVILTLNHSAREGGEPLRDAPRTSLKRCAHRGRSPQTAATPLIQRKT